MTRARRVFRGSRRKTSRRIFLGSRTVQKGQLPSPGWTCSAPHLCAPIWRLVRHGCGPCMNPGHGAAKYPLSVSLANAGEGRARDDDRFH